MRVELRSLCGTTPPRAVTTRGFHDWCNKGRGMCYPVCGMVHIKEPLLLIGKSSLCGGSGFPVSLSEWSLTICQTPYIHRLLNTFYLRLYGVRHMVKDHSESEREETRCRHMGYSSRFTARVILYAPSHRQDCTYHCLRYTSRGAQAGTRNSSVGPPNERSIQRPIAS